MNRLVWLIFYLRHTIENAVYLLKISNVQVIKICSKDKTTFFIYYHLNYFPYPNTIHL